MADVWRATKPGPEGFEKKVAVKVPRRGEPDAAAFTRFLKEEARRVVELRHPNIVQVLDFDVSEGQYYLAMELMGPDLGRVCGAIRARGVPFPLHHATFVFGELLAALDHAHTQRPPIVHCDVAPSNVLLSDSGEVKLGDFGIARLAAEATEETKNWAGKWRYMSPEQRDRLRPDGRSDLYQAGLVMYEVLTGREVAADDMPTLREARPEVPSDLDELIGRLLVRERDRRVQQAMDALDELRGCASYRADRRAFAIWLREVVRANTENATQVRVEGREEVAAPGPVPAAVAAPAATVPPRPRRKARAVLAAAAVVALGAAAFWILKPPNPQPPEPPGLSQDATSTTEPAPDTGPADAPKDVLPREDSGPPQDAGLPPHKVPITFRLAPRGATLSIDGKPTRRRKLWFKRGTVHTYTASARCHVEEQQKFLAKRDRTIPIALKRTDISCVW